MTQSTWAMLLNRLPEEWRATLVVKTINGTEIAVQSIVRIDAEILVIRGRVAGTTEQGQLYVIPLARLETICIQKPPKEEEVQKTLAEIFPPEVPLPVEKPTSGSKATGIMKLSPESMERLKSLGIGKTPENS